MPGSNIVVAVAWAMMISSWMLLLFAATILLRHQGALPLWPLLWLTIAVGLAT